MQTGPISNAATHIMVLETELESIQSLLPSVDDDCREKLTRVHQSISNIVEVMKMDLGQELP